ncbi:RluA family pseudouridine synthase [Psychromicrobium xiongbiense]|uniref:RluA family pseudouridine synthase n=1 Tax=Psychromicrobium xiongbiense TaxID=3051184 RepID=UPI002555E771|nr:RluA family pseudouridine synthase [Psychromicrobium sp. YIM S02556]
MSETNAEQLRTVVIPEHSDGQRADAVLAELLGVSRSQAAALLSAGRVTVDAATLAKSTRVEAGTVLTVREPEVSAQSAAAAASAGVRLDVLWEDEDIVVVDKPVGVAAHGSPGWVGPTVIDSLRASGYRISTSGAPERAGIVHRLDVGTSGAMAVAKTERAYTGLKQAFKDRTVNKVYHTVVQGLPDPLHGTIDAPIGRHPGHDWRFAVLEDGRPSITDYEVLEAFGRASLVEVHLRTGRTHQIRVHFSALHHPCAGDLTYGADPRLAAELGLTRQWLHARTLGFTHPVTGDWIEVTSEYPSDLDYALEVLRGPA